MQTVYSDAHEAHAYTSEFERGALTPAKEVPERGRLILDTVRSRGLGPLIAPSHFGNEPILRVTAPLPAAQLVESRLVNILHFQTLIAAKAARMTLAAPDKILIDFGLRPAHGAEAGLLAARASYIAGFAGTATVLAEKLFGIPTFGTMAHSFIQIYDDEAAAFEDFARSRPQSRRIRRR